ncbi:MAG: GT-D fold domain-containing protein [Rickettsiales bacterium]|jgi:hypothetical protein|nr:GT-D fold domain-containing protein [Rickettsiales bacterium]
MTRKSGYCRAKEIVANALCGLVPSKSLRYRIRSALSVDRWLAGNLPKMYSARETLRLLQAGWSMARFGDGELPYIADKRPIPFQAYDEGLARRLAEILKHPPPSPFAKDGARLLLTIPHYYGFYYQKFWHENMDRLIPLLNFDRTYGDTIITREPIIWGVESYRKIWRGRRAAFVFSQKGRFCADPRFFDNIRDREFIDIPPADAWGEYDQILARCREMPKDWIFLIAAGPCATVLAYDLALDGYQALDIGHLPNCYAWEKRESIMPELLPVSK